MLERHSVTEALRSDDGRVTGVRAALLDESGRKTGETRDFSADVVLAADGNSTRTAVSLGIRKRDDRPLGVAVRTYFTSPRHDDDWMEGWLELPGRDGKLLPGYGWVFGVGDGTSNVGLGILNSSKEFGKLDYKQVLREWTAGMPAEWGFTPENQVGEIRGAALPMGFNRTPHYSPGLLLLGDAGGMVSPFNGEGISYAMESARFAAEFIIDARPPRSASAGGSSVRRRCAPCGVRGLRAGPVGFALHPGPRLRRADRQAGRDEAGPADGHAHSRAHALRGAAAGQPDRSRGQGLRGPRHPGPGIAGPGHVQPRPAARHSHSSANSAVSATKS